MKNDYIQIRMNDEEKAELNALATEKDISVSQFVREAVREKIAALKGQVATYGADVTKDGVTIGDSDGNIVDQIPAAATVGG